MNVQTEMQRFAAMDFKKAKGLNTGITQGVNGVNKVLKNLGVENDELYTVISLSGSALQVVGGTLGMLQGIKALYGARNAKEEAEAGILTSIKMALGPVGWAEIAIAAGAMAAAGVGMYALVNNIEVGDFDLSTAAGINNAVNAVGAV